MHSGGWPCWQRPSAAAWRQPFGDIRDENGRYYEFDRPRDGARYVTGADWAKEEHFTVIVTLRVDTEPWRLVAYERVNRRPWPELVAKLNWRAARYHKNAGLQLLNTDGRRYYTVVHDAQGVGGAVEDYIDHKAEGFHAVGRERSDLYADFVLALQHRKLIGPRVSSLVDATRLLVEADFGTSGHVPDPVAALALAVRAALGKSIPKTDLKKRPGGVKRARAV